VTQVTIREGAPMSDSAGTVVEDYNGPEPDLKRVMGPKLLLLFIVGDILGAGIYARRCRLRGCRRR